MNIMILMNQGYIVILIYNVNTKIQRYITRYDVLSSDVLTELDMIFLDVV